MTAPYLTPTNPNGVRPHSSTDPEHARTTARMMLQRQHSGMDNIVKFRPGDCGVDFNQN